MDGVGERKSQQSEEFEGGSSCLGFQNMSVVK